MSTGKSSREKSDGGILGSRPRLVNLFTTYLLEKSIVGTYPWKFDLCLDILDYLQTALVVLLRHPPHSQPRPSFIACFNPLLGTFSERGGPQWWSISVCCGWVSSYFCSSSTRSSEMTSLLLGLVFLLFLLSYCHSSVSPSHSQCVFQHLSLQSARNFIYLALFLSLAYNLLYYHYTLKVPKHIPVMNSYD